MEIIARNGVAKSQILAAIREAGIEIRNEGYTHRIMNTWKAVSDGSLYDDVTTSCSTQQSNLVSAIAARDALETALSNSMSTFNGRLYLSNEIRGDKNSIDLEIWANRGQIGQSNSDMDNARAFEGVINDTEFLDEIN